VIIENWGSPGVPHTMGFRFKMKKVLKLAVCCGE